jgi:hypothetical protein
MDRSINSTTRKKHINRNIIVINRIQSTQRQSLIPIIVLMTMICCCCCIGQQNKRSPQWRWPDAHRHDLASLQLHPFYYNNNNYYLRALKSSFELMRQAEQIQSRFAAVAAGGDISGFRGLLVGLPRHRHSYSPVFAAVTDTVTVTSTNTV